MEKKRAYNYIDLTGKTFGKLTVIKEIDSLKHHTVWLCRCQCGKETQVEVSNLRNGNTQSCGCLRGERLGDRRRTHGMGSVERRERLYSIWAGMKYRCFNPKGKSFKDYGGRGISVCKQWLQFENFRDWALKTGYQDDLEIDRINNDGNYEPNNCRWATRSQNQSNRRNNRLITINGETKTLSQWAEDFGLSINTIVSRIRNGWVNEELIQPIRKARLQAGEGVQVQGHGLD